ncbi:MAG: energy-coupling factor transporter transmembrane component T family protein [Turicibacter sanguinis]|uniref:Cobalt ABC transporter permease n=2 Tax=Turicibacter sanguinis TaxID=154288 RepID=A0A9X4XG31_9FIRM|nr:MULTISPECIES: energy-coupling factor transporter transmembrane component T [Turicibacter]EFF64720.1 cobalt transport protein [Turicibacter sanguinis PC909]EGC90945.1 cobalt transport protein [Turicibacter sp. HGF1]MBP3904771.1 energy-coupling factor transporter transmembrane protein EcfT [Turicibacter sp.]MCU7192503.1 energy-coupling factor transporter transmembrane protein EcfT [Turicibacter sanguinis]MCU7195360.1 energy-coupling factor transporter transmembrane protein EcfT [Turicibacter 
MNGIIIGQYLPGQSFWHRLDPRSKIIATSLFVISSFLIEQWFFIGLLVVVELIAMKLTKIPLDYFFRSLKPIWFFVILTFFLQVLFNKQGNLLFSLGPIGIYDEGLNLGFFMSIRLIIVVLISTLLTLTTKPSDLTLALESLFKPFKKVGLPVSELALMISIALRFIPTLFEETQKILKAQASRGVDIKEGKFKDKVMQLISLLVPLFILSFKRADELANAMEVRGYVPGRPKTSINRLCWHVADTGLIVVCLVIFVGAIVF